ncbi:MAG: hypothetical protein HKN48_00335 [Flavobacteriaceae bacterium]|nr:hypothetical protein [Flavobacteriaceae bacterium]
MKATKETMKICNELYGSSHHRNNRANAFRHALWNYKISEKANEILKNDQKSTKWAKKVTFLYENVTKNDFLDQKMDIINNEFGRNLFLTKKFKNRTELINFIQNSAKKAQKIDKNTSFDEISENLTYISE